MTPRQIDNSVSVSCDVAAVARFFCLGFIGRASKVAQNISNKPYLTLPSFRCHVVEFFEASDWPGRQFLAVVLAMSVLSVQTGKCPG